MYHLFKILKIKEIKKERIAKFGFLDLFKLKKNINIQIQFSWMRSNSFLIPHTDAPNKLLSLMLYFPEIDNFNTHKMGTIFWDYKKENYENNYSDFATLKKKQKFYIKISLRVKHYLDLLKIREAGIVYPNCVCQKTNIESL